MAKAKVIYWKKEIAKYIGPLNKKMDDLFREYNKRQKSVNAKTTPQQNELWKREFQKKYERLDKKIDAAYLRLYLKYHVSAGSTKSKPKKPTTMTRKRTTAKAHGSSTTMRDASRILKAQKDDYKKIFRAEVKKSKDPKAGAKKAGRIYRDRYGSTAEARWKKALKRAK